MRRMALVLTACLLLATSGCIQVEEAVTLEKDLSGTAAFNFSVNMEPFAAFAAQFKREMEGKEGKPTKEEIDAARQEMIASRKSSADMPTKEEIEKDMPPGVKLLETKFTDEGLKFGGNVKVAFDHFDKLQQLDMKKKEAGPTGEAQPASEEGAGPQSQQPFGDLHLKDEGKTLLLTGKAFNPAADSPAPPLDDAGPEVEAALKSMKIVTKITSPFEVIEHNATRKEGKTLIWEYNYETLQKMTPEQMKEGIRARFKK
ncbi:MAG TPA: hypothetical protein VF789_02610 [Thermoanaerobaculia bacterium]